MDFQETFAAVARADIYRFLLALTVTLDWEIYSWDIDSAFLYGDIDGDVYIELPQELGEGSSESVGKLLRSLYDLKQAPRIWVKTFYKAFDEMGLVQLKSEPSAFSNASPK